MLLHEHAKAVFVHPRDDPWLSLCCWLVPRIFPSHYDVSLHQVESLAAFYEIRTQPTTQWHELARRLVVDFDPYFRRHSLDPAGAIEARLRSNQAVDRAADGARIISVSVAGEQGGPQPSGAVLVERQAAPHRSPGSDNRGRIGRVCRTRNPLGLQLGRS